VMSSPDGSCPLLVKAPRPRAHRRNGRPSASRHLFYWTHVRSALLRRANPLSKRAAEGPIVPGSMVGALQAADLLTALRALGLDTADLCRRVGLRPALLRDPAGSVPMHVAAELLAVAARRAGDPLVGLRAGARAQPR